MPINDFINKLDESKTCLKCGNYLEGFENCGPEGCEYDGDHCELTEVGRAPENPLKRIINDMLCNFDEARWNEYEGIGDIGDLKVPVLIGNLCPFFKKVKP